jgi:hypothetical protein
LDARLTTLLCKKNGHEIQSESRMQSDKIFKEGYDLKRVVMMMMMMTTTTTTTTAAANTIYKEHVSVYFPPEGQIT